MNTASGSTLNMKHETRVDLELFSKYSDPMHSVIVNYYEEYSYSVLTSKKL